MLWMLLVACNAGKESSKPDDTGTPESPSDDSEGTTDDSILVIDDSDSKESEESEDTAANHAAYVDLYDPDVLHTVELVLDDAAVAELAASPEEYVKAGIVFDGALLFDEIGVRLKGNTDDNSLETGKPSFKIRLNEYESGQHIGKVTRLTLSSMNGDPAQIREVLACLAWNEAGMLAPKASYATVSYTLNGENFPLGLYANIETIDANFLEHRAMDPDGALWEAGDSADFTSSGVQHFDLAEGDGSEADLQAAWQTVWTASDDFYTTADGVMQMDQFIQYWAWRVVTGSGDGYPYELDDYYLYGDPVQGDRYSFAPWDMEKSWDTGLDWEVMPGVVGLKCYHDGACLTRFQSEVADVIDTYEAMQLDAMAGNLYSLTEVAVGDDVRRKYSYQEVTTARTNFEYRLSVWADLVRAQVGVR